MAKEVSRRQDISDVFTALNATGMAKRCPGGRIVLRNYVCIHCGHDFTDGKCGSRKRKPE